MELELIFFISTVFQILPLCIIVYSLQSHSKENIIKAGIIFFAQYVLNLVLVISGMYPTFVFIILTLTTIILISFLYKKDWIDAIIDYSIYLLSVFVFGLIIEFIIRKFTSLCIDTNKYHNALFMFIVFAFSICIYFFIPMKDIVKRYRSYLRKFNLIIASIFIFYFILIEDYITNTEYNFMIILAFIAILILSIFLFVEFWNDRNRQSLIKQHEQYIKSMEPLIADLRAEQHDLKNIITVMINNYPDNIDAENNPFALSLSSITERISEIDYFVYTSNKTIGLMVYLKFRECASKGIRFKYTHPVYELNFPLEDFEFSSILVNLINNAICAIESHKPSAKEICVEMGQEDGKVYFSVSNTGNPIPFNEISKLFIKGYTTKENKNSHGFGLYNVKKIISKYNGRIEVTNNKPYVTFKILF